MALDPNIAMGYRGIELPDPVAQYGQIAQIQNARQTNQLNALKMQEAQANMEERNALRQLNPTSADYEAQLFKLNPQLGIAFRKEASAAAASKAQQLSHETTAAKTKQEMLGQALRDISGRPSDANITAHMEDVLASPLYSEAEKTSIQATAKSLLGMPFEQRQSVLSQQGAKAGELRPQVIAPSGSLVQGGKAIFTAPAAPEKPPAPPSMVAEFNFAKTPEGGGFRGDYQQFVTARAAAGRAPVQPVAPTITQIVDPTNPSQMITVDARRYQGGGVGSAGVIGVGGKEPGVGSMKPLTEGQTIKLRTDVGKDYKAASTALSQIDDLLASATAVKTSPGLSAATGFTGKYLPSFSEGGAAQAETRLANLRGKVTALGKATAAMSGAIGSIANQEWKILSDQIAVLDETKGTKPLLEQIGLLENQAKGAADRIRDTYEKTRAEDFERFPQFRDLPVSKSSAPAATMSNVVITPDGQSHSFPTPAAAAQFKKAAGIP